MTELSALRQLAELAAIAGDRDGAVRIHRLVDMIEAILIRLDALEPIFGIAPSGPRLERRLDG
jgi:hypothetical protein